MDTNYKVLMALMGLSIGGAETHVIELCKALKNKGVEVLVASNGGAYEEELSQYGIKHFKVPLHNKNFLNVFSGYMALKKIIIENDIKLVHAHARIPAFLCGLLQKELGFRLVTTAHLNFKTNFPYNILSNWGEYTLAVSEDIQEYLNKQYKIPLERIGLTVNGIDTNKFSGNVDYSDIMQEFNLLANNKRIVCVSRLDTDRSLPAHKLIEAAEELYKNHKNLEIIIVGDGDDYKQVEKEAIEMNKRIGHRIIIMAGARVKDVNKFVACADIFVNVSRSLLEAMAAAKPAILAGNQGYLGIFDETKLQISIDTNFCFRGCGDTTKDALVKDISTLFSYSNEKREALGLYARSVIEKFYSVEKMADDALSLYEKVRTPNKAIDVMLYGYYGSNNNGDDALLKSIIDDLRLQMPDIKILVLSRRPKDTREKFKVSSINSFNIMGILKAMKNTNTLIYGGGTLLQDLTSTRSLLYYLKIIDLAHKKGLKIMLYANGIGPISSSKNRQRIKDAVKKIDVITLRDKQSRDVLNSLDIDKKMSIHLTADAVFSLRNTDANEIKPIYSYLGLHENTKYFVVALRNWHSIKDSFSAVISEFADYMNKKYDLTAVFIPMQPDIDTKISKNVIRRMSTKGVFLGCNFTINQLLGLISKSEFMLAMRLHGLIYAAKTEVPCIGLVYDPKVAALMELIQQKTYSNTEDLELGRLKDYGDLVMNNRSEIIETIKENTEILKNSANKNIEFAFELINRKEF